MDEERNTWLTRKASNRLERAQKELSDLNKRFARELVTVLESGEESRELEILRLEQLKAAQEVSDLNLTLRELKRERKRLKKLEELAAFVI